MNHMNFFYVLPSLLVLAKSVQAGFDHPIFLASRITHDDTWCLTANKKTKRVSLERCDFDSASPTQIWYRQDVEWFVTALDDDLCLARSSKDTELLLAPCWNDDDTFDTTFYQDYSPSDGTVVQLSDGDNKCAAPRDDDPSPGDKVKMQLCEPNNDKFYWHFEYASCDLLPSNQIRLCSSDGCLKAFHPGETSLSRNQVKIVPEQVSDVWHQDSWNDDALCMGTGLIRLSRDPSLCLQQGVGSEIRENTKLRVFPCECNNVLQQFYCDKPEKARSSPDLCMATPATRTNVMLKKCDTTADAKFLQAEPVFSDEVYPMTLVAAYQGYDTTVRDGAPWKAAYEPTTDTYICIYQQGDGDLRVLRSETAEDCNRNRGERIFHTRLSVEQPDGRKYETKLARDGNWITRLAGGGMWAWKSGSSVGAYSGNFRLVLNQDDSLSILNDDEGRLEIWNSDADETSRFYSRPLILMTSTSNLQTYRVTDDPLTKSLACLYQGSDGNFRCLRSTTKSNCINNIGKLIYESGFSEDLDDGLGRFSYISFLQNDGNLRTWAVASDENVWKTCSAQGYQGVFHLALTEGDTLAILDASLNPVWESDKDPSCVL